MLGKIQMGRHISCKAEIFCIIFKHGGELIKKWATYKGPEVQGKLEVQDFQVDGPRYCHPMSPISNPQSGL